MPCFIPFSFRFSHPCQVLLLNPSRLGYIHPMDTESTEQNQDTKSSGFVRWFLIPVIVFFIYILSSGPAKKVAEYYPQSYGLIATIYHPLEKVCSWNTTTTKAYVWYLSRWHVFVGF